MLWQCIICLHAVQSPDASEREIKQAYYKVMRACHPDVAVSLDEEDDGEAAEVCVFVNDIYEVCAPTLSGAHAAQCINGRTG